jgi:hypothetical protein
VDYPTHRLDPNELKLPLFHSDYDEEPELPPIGTPVPPRTVPVREPEEDTGWGSIAGNLTSTILTILMLGG